MYNSKQLIGEGFKFYFIHYKVTIILFVLQVSSYFLINQFIKIFWIQETIGYGYLVLFLTIFVWMLISSFYRLFVLNYIKLIETTDKVSIFDAFKNTFKYNFISNIISIAVASVAVFLSFMSDAEKQRKQEKLGPPTAGAFRTDGASLASSIVKLSAYWLFQLAICYTVLNRTPMYKTKKNIENLLSLNLKEMIKSILRIGMLTGVILIPFVGALYLAAENNAYADPQVFTTLPGLIAAILLYTGSIEVIHTMMIVLWNEKWKIIAKEAIHNNERIPDFDHAELPSLFNKKPDLPLEGFID